MLTRRMLPNPTRLQRMDNRKGSGKIRMPRTALPGAAKAAQKVRQRAISQMQRQARRAARGRARAPTRTLASTARLSPQKRRLGTEAKAKAAVMEKARAKDIPPTAVEAVDLPSRCKACRPAWKLQALGLAQAVAGAGARVMERARQQGPMLLL